jgi:hypothetical protein
VPLPALLYDAGLQHLMLRQFALARQCFAQAAEAYGDTVRVKHRMFLLACAVMRVSEGLSVGP